MRNDTMACGGGERSRGRGGVSRGAGESEEVGFESGIARTHLRRAQCVEQELDSVGLACEEAICLACEVAVTY